VAAEGDGGVDDGVDQAAEEQDDAGVVLGVEVDLAGRERLGTVDAAGGEALDHLGREVALGRQSSDAVGEGTVRGADGGDQLVHQEAQQGGRGSR
jgi:hypothetical protein